MKSFDWRNLKTSTLRFRLDEIIGMWFPWLRSTFLFSPAEHRRKTLTSYVFSVKPPVFWTLPKFHYAKLIKITLCFARKKKRVSQKNPAFNNKRPFLTLSKVSSRLSQFNDDVIYTLSQQTPSIFGRLIFSLATEERLWTPTGNLSRNSVPGLKFSEPNFNWRSVNRFKAGQARQFKKYLFINFSLPLR